jgi:hypothetical protein
MARSARTCEGPQEQAADRALGRRSEQVAGLRSQVAATHLVTMRPATACPPFARPCCSWQTRLNAEAGGQGQSVLASAQK